MLSRRTFIRTSAVGAGLIGSRILPVSAWAGNHSIESSCCLLPAHDIPLIADVDILIAGSTSGAIAAAVRASRNGASVFMVSPMPYPGEDICGTLRLWQDSDRLSGHPMAKAIFTSGPPAPLHVKTVLEEELIKERIPFVYCSYLVDLLYDKDNKVSGALIVNRSGCQAIRAKVVLDATMDATSVHIAGIPLAGEPADKQHYEFTVVGNKEKQDDRIIATTGMITMIQVDNKTYTARRYTFGFPDAGRDYAALNSIEQQIRDITWDADQVDSSDLLFYIPSLYIRTNEEITSVNEDDIPLGAFKPRNMEGLYILSGYSGVSRELARRMLDPVSFMRLGDRIGAEVAAQALRQQGVKKLDIRSRKGRQINGQAREITDALRPSYTKGKIKVSGNNLPILGEYDLVILGGGTAGAPAGISASRQGIKTLTLEYLHGLGGLTTMGLIGRYWDGFREGFTQEVDRGVCNMAPENHPRQKKRCDVEWPSDWKMEWFRKETRKAGGEIWFGSLGCGAVTDGRQVCGVVIATPFGRGVVLAKTIVDSTGSADIAIAAGARYDYTGKHTVAIQGAGLSRRNPDDFYNNTDWTFIDDTDILDISRVFVAAKAKYRNMYDIGKLPQTRERRRVIAEHNVSVLDVINSRRYPDTLSYHTSSFDTHGYTVDPYFTLKPPEKRHKIYNADVPLRTLLPDGLDGILVTGLGTGAHRDAMPVIRMQPCLQNQGYAVGYLVAQAVKEGKGIRAVDMKKIQQHLISIGNLPDRVLSDKDNFPFPDDQFIEAAKMLPDNMTGLEILLTDPHKAIPLLKEQLRQRPGDPSQINYAHTLSMLGDPSGLSVLMDKINQYAGWDQGWPYTGMGQFGPCMSQLDSLIISLGNSRKREALPVITAHARRLLPEDSFSHFRAVCMAFEKIGHKDAADVLFEILNKPGMRNKVILSYEDARNLVTSDKEETSDRNHVLKELHLARALYRCGDKNQLGANILRSYTNDLQNHYARHARGVLT